jgi:hypothetical protein
MGFRLQGCWNDGKEASGRAARIKALGKGAMGRALGEGASGKGDDPAKRLSLWAGHGSVGAFGVGVVAMGKKDSRSGSCCAGRSYP